MKKYTGTHTCPYCNKEFSWEFIDDGYRPGIPQIRPEVIELNEDTSVAKCKRSRTRNHEYHALSCYCPHCQTSVEIADIDDIPKELF